MNQEPNTQSFHGLGIAPKLLEIITKLNFTVPTPIQKQSIPPALEGTDVLGIAQTGTGKTLAFGIPMLQRLAIHKGMGLVLLPTRELAVQVNEALQALGRSLNLKTVVLIGGENIGRQLRVLRQNPHLIIATPGRLIDHLQQKSVKLTSVKILVLDEADRMLDMGFLPQIKQILETVPKERQTMLFSATMPHEITAIAQRYMKLPVRIEVAPSGTAPTSVSQELFFVQRTEKMPLLTKLLGEYRGSVLIFSRTKHGAKKIAQILLRAGHATAEIHSNRSLNQRLEALNGFKRGKYRVLVATDIAARGIDVSGIEVVINYDLPESPSDYVHRIGRTGRASSVGHAISFATPDQKRDVWAIERLIKKQLAVSKAVGLPKMEPEKFEPRPFARRKPYGDKFKRPFSKPFNKSFSKPFGKPFGKKRGFETFDFPANKRGHAQHQRRHNRFQPGF